MNLVSQLFVKESSWQLRPDENATEAIDGHDGRAYGLLKIMISITDQNGKAKTQQIEFVVVPMPYSRSGRSRSQSLLSDCYIPRDEEA